jgi:hypothetical protein
MQTITSWISSLNTLQFADGHSSNSWRTIHWDCHTEGWKQGVWGVGCVWCPRCRLMFTGREKVISQSIFGGNRRLFLLLQEQKGSVDGLKCRWLMIETLLRDFDHLRLRRAAKLRFAAERSDAPAYDGDRQWCDMTCLGSRAVKIVQFLVYGYTRHFTTVKDSENPCCHPTTFYNIEGQWKPLPPAYDILHGLLSVSFPCRDPIRLYAGVWTASKAQLRKERRERNPCRDPVRFYAVFIYTLTFVSG